MRAGTLAGPPWPLLVSVDSLFQHRYNGRISARCGECRVAALPQCQIDGRTPSRIVFPHRLLNYSGQGFLWRDHGSSRQTDTAGRPAGRSVAWQEYSGSLQKKNSQPPRLVLQSKRVSLRAALQTSVVTTSWNREPWDCRGAAASCKINGWTWQFSHCSHLLVRQQQHVSFRKKRGRVTLRQKFLIPCIWTF